MKAIRKCKYCGKEFVARSGMQKFCCEECQAKAKEARKKRQQDFMNAVEPVIDLQCQEYLTFAKAAILMGCSRQYVYKLVNEGKLAASRISSRMAFIRKADIERMLAGNPYHRVLPTNRPKKASVPTSKKEIANAKNCQGNNQESEVLDYISGEEVMRIYKVKKSWLYTSAKRNQVPVCRIAGMNYYSRKHMKCSLFTDNERALYVENEISPKLLLFLGNSTNDIIIFDAMLGFLDVGFKSPEAPSDGETE